MFAISGYRSLLQSFEDSFLELMTAENSNITVGILMLSVAIPEIQVFPEYKYFRFGHHIAISGCRALLQSFEGIFFELVMVEKPLIVVGISTLSIIVPEI